MTKAEAKRIARERINGWRLEGDTASMTELIRDSILHVRWLIDRGEKHATEPTEQGLQYVMPGCEKDKTRGPTQADLF